MKFDINIPTRIHFGCGVLEEAVIKERKLFSERVLIVSTKSAEKLGYVNRIAMILKSFSEIEHVVKFQRISANPKLWEVNEGIDLALLNGVGSVIGIGGGSAMDAAKAVAIGAGAGEHIDRYFFEGLQPDGRTLPIVAIPTTAGTGSEVSKSGILSCPEKKIKTGVRGEHLYPAAAIVDPELTYTVPLGVTMETGFDVMAHAVESYLSKASSYFTHVLSEQAIVMVAENLPVLAEDITDKEARKKMSYASMIMGINLGNASTVLPHRMQYPVGALTDTGHGKGLAALYPAWLEMTYRYAPEKWDRIGGLLSGRKCSGIREVEESLSRFMDKTCGRPKLKDLGFSVGDAEMLTNMVTGNISLDPAGKEEGVVYKIYRRALLE